MKLKAALTALGDASVGPGRNERLELQIKGMYATTCADCQTPTTADAFDWDVDTNEPVAKHYVCLPCGGPRSAPTDDEDRSLARRFGRSGPDYHFLLSRTVAPGDTVRGQAEETLAVYPPRSLAAIAILLHKLESLALDHATHRLLAGLLVAAFDATTTLGQERPKVLSAPRRYREVNVWLALESAFGLLAGPASPDWSTTLDQLLTRPDQAAIYVHSGPMRELAARLPSASSSLLLTAVPRPNQAFWDLSATWAGWLWGPESVEAFRGSLQRRRYDWNWHARALHQTLAAAQPAMANAGRLVCMLAEAEPGFEASLVAAAAGAGYHLRGWTLRADTAEAQLEFEPGEPTTGPSRGPDLFRAAREAAVEVLQARCEPNPWIGLHFAAWCNIAANRLFPWDAADPLSSVNRALQQVAGDTSTFQHLSESASDDPATGLWTLADETFGRQPLTDRVEAEVQRCLTDGDSLDEHDLLRDVCAAFPGVLTPGRGLVMACLVSYGIRDGAGLWRLRAEDAPEVRAGELQAILAELRALATRSAFEAGAGNPQVWRDGAQTAYIFAVLTSAVISAHLRAPRQPARRRFLVLPGGRVGLVEHKLRNDPQLRQLFVDGAWTIVKFRQVRRLMTDEGLTRATLEPAFAGDPLGSLQQMLLPEKGEDDRG